MAEAEMMWDEDADQAFGNTQFTQASLRRQIKDLERVIEGQKKAQKQAVERAQADAEQIIESQKAQIKRLKKQKESVDFRLKELSADYGHLNDSYDEVCRDLQRVEPEMEKQFKELMAQYESVTMRKVHALLIKAQDAEKRWIFYTITLQFIRDLLSTGHLSAHDMDSDKKELLIKMQKLLLDTPALPVWYKPPKEQTEDPKRTAEEFLRQMLAGDAEIKRREDDDE